MHPFRAATLLVALATIQALAGCAPRRGAAPSPAPQNAPRPASGGAPTGAAPGSSPSPGAPGVPGGVPGATQRKTIAAATATSRKVPGLFNLYQDTVNGSLHLAVSKEQLGKEFVYFAHVENGVVSAGSFRGAYGDNSVFTIRKHFNRIEFVTENNNFEFDPKHALSRAASANISPATLASQEIVAADPATGTYLIRADDLFLTETLTQVKPTPNPLARPGQFFSLGNLSRGKTKYLRLNNYPANTDVVVEYVYENPAPLNGGGREVTDARNVSVQVRHSLIEMPKNGYEPRYDDPRVGYFTTQRNDMVSTSATPYRDLIQRWHLVKKDPGAAVSEPVEPITFWLENTTPVEIREIVRDATLAWNLAFEQAGFRNAVVVKQQPDDADWDAGDIRYNVLRWTSSPQPPFGGYGPSFVNPRTGQILGADIMLEYVYLTNRLNQDKVFNRAALAEEGLDQAIAEVGNAVPDPRRCSASQQMHHQTLTGLAALRAVEADPIVVSEYLRQSIYYLILHEVGHTLGLNHNMKASGMLGPEQIHDRALTQRVGLIGSVMDYPAVNLAPLGKPQGDFFITRPGPYDVWAIQFGYTPGLEGAARERLLARSTERALAFGNDADDMRAPGLGMDPRVMIGDINADVVGSAPDRFRRLNHTMGRLRERYTNPGQSFQEMRNAYLILTGDYASTAAAVSRYVGGVYVDRAMAGQPGATRPFTPISQGEQQRAMKVLADYVFAPNAFQVPDDLYGYLAAQRRGYDHFGQAEDPKVHARALAVQRSVLMHLMHPRTLTRMMDTRLYGNQYTPAEMMGDLTDAVFAADAAGNVNTFRQGLQLEYVTRLTGMIGEQKALYDTPAQSLAMQQLRRIDRLMAGKRGDAESTAHAAHVRFLIEKALDAD